MVSTEIDVRLVGEAHCFARMIYSGICTDTDTVLELHDCGAELLELSAPNTLWCL